jgi:hypothetical protein
MCKVKYFICPMSKNIVDSVLEMNSDKLGLLPTRRQIDYNGGYVFNWNTKSFTKYVKNLSPNTVIERDHSGELQGDSNHFFSYEEDSENVDIIHIDPWIKHKDFKDGLKSTIDTIKFIHGLNKNVQFEIGTEESIRPFTILELDYMIEHIHNTLPWDMVSKITYVCIQSGVKLDLVNQKNVGEFDLDKLKKMISLCKFFGKKTKEHNGDYLSDDEIKIRFDNGLHSLNIGPEIAQIETQTYIDFMTVKEIDLFYDICYESKKWVKWVPKNYKFTDKEELIKICGHYNFNKLDMDDIHDIVKDNIKNKLIQLLQNV